MNGEYMELSRKFTNYIFWTKHETWLPPPSDYERATRRRRNGLYNQ